MENASFEGTPTVSDYGSLVMLFDPPAQRYWVTEPLCDQYGSVVDLQIDGQSFYTNEAPMVVQPDYLIDNRTSWIIGFSFGLSSPSWMLPRCKAMLRGLDACSICLKSNDPETVWVDVIWGNTESYDRVVAQLDFGLWAFLYTMKEPNLFRNAEFWTPPKGIVICDLAQLAFPVSILASDTSDTMIEPMQVPRD